jgi:hypothetical protein
MTHIPQVTTWSVHLQLGDRDGHSHATARLHTGSPRELTASGTAELSPGDPSDVPEIGFELAAGRALIALGELLVSTGRADVDGVLTSRA